MPDSPISTLRPMEAVAALYHGEDPALSEAILADLSQRVFQGPDVVPAGPAQRFAARLSLRLLQATTRTHKSGASGVVYRNRLLERSGHPYAWALLNSTSEATANLVEGGDPMNGPYLMLAPAIKANSNRWDGLFFNSVQGKDVQWRFILETRATYEAAQAILDNGRPVRLKAVAAGTGLSLIMVYDRLVRDGCDPTRITALITDRDAANTRKTKHLLAKLATSGGNRFTCSNGYGIAARTEDVLAGSVHETEAFDIVTAVGILEYFEGTTTGTTRERLGFPAAADAPDDQALTARISAMTAPGGKLVINTYRNHASIRILEIFGKRFAFRGPAELTSLLGQHGFLPFRWAGSGHIYDVGIFVKNSSRKATDSAKD